MSLTSRIASVFLKDVKAKASKPISKRLPQELVRIDRRKLELIYVRDGLVFNAINKQIFSDA